jgi:hypothetical protein
VQFEPTKHPKDIQAFMKAHATTRSLYPSEQQLYRWEIEGKLKSRYYEMHGILSSLNWSGFEEASALKTYLDQSQEEIEAAVLGANGASFGEYEVGMLELVQHRHSNVDEDTLYPDPHV